MDYLSAEDLFSYVGIRLPDSRVVSLDSVANRTMEIHGVPNIPVSLCFMAMYPIRNRKPHGRHITSLILNDDDMRICLSVKVKYNSKKEPTYATISHNGRRIQSLPFESFYRSVEILHDALNAIEKDLEELAKTGKDTHGLGRVWCIWEPELRGKYNIEERVRGRKKHEHRRSE